MPSSREPEFSLFLPQGGADELLALNPQLKAHGLQLTQKDVHELLAFRTRALKNQGRIELGTGITQAIVKRLAESPYAVQESFVRTVDELYETFHYIKNATSDFVDDEELLDAVMDVYENVCRGSAELLMGKGAQRIIDNFKAHRGLSEPEPPDEEEESDWNDE